MAPLGRCPGRWLLYRPDSKARRLLLLAGYESAAWASTAPTYSWDGERRAGRTADKDRLMHGDARKKGDEREDMTAPWHRLPALTAPAKFKIYTRRFAFNLLSRNSFSLPPSANFLSFDRYDLNGGELIIRWGCSGISSKDFSCGGLHLQGNERRATKGIFYRIDSELVD